MTQRWALARIPPPPVAADGLPGARAGRNSARSLLEARRKVHRLRAHDSAGLCLLFDFADRSFACAPGTRLSRPRRVDGRPRLPGGRRFSCSGGRSGVPSTFPVFRSWFKIADTQIARRAMQDQPSPSSVKAPPTAFHAAGVYSICISRPFSTTTCLRDFVVLPGD